MGIRTAFLIKEEAERIIKCFADSPSSKHRAVTKIVKRILLNGPYCFNGRTWEVNAKSLGAGVYELSIKLKD